MMNQLKIFFAPLKIKRIRQEGHVIAKASFKICQTTAGKELMTDKPIKDLLCSFKDKQENTPEGRHAIAKAIFTICQTTAGKEELTDPSIRMLLFTFQGKSNPTTIQQSITMAFNACNG